MARTRAKYWDPDGDRWGFPTYPWQMAPSHLATYRQLQAVGLRPGGQPVRAQLMWRSRRSRTGTRIAYLYDVEAAKPKRQATAAQQLAIAKALAARRTCPDCGQTKPYYIPQRYGACLDCHGWEVNP